MPKTYKIKDNVTGQVVEVPEEQLSQYGLSAPAPSKTQPNNSANSSNVKINQNTITGHTLEEHAQALEKAKQFGDADAIKSITDNYNREYQYQKDFVQPSQKVTADKTKKEDAYKSISNILSNLEQNYQKGGGANGRLLGMINDITSATGLNDPATLYNNEKSGFAATLKSLTGDTGVMTDQDYERLSKLLPGFTATKGEAQGAFDDLKSQIATKYGDQPPLSNKIVAPQEKQTGNILTDSLNDNPLIKFLLGSAINTAQDVGTGIRSSQSEGNLKKQDDMASTLENDAYSTKDLEKKKSLLKEANNLRTGISNEAGNISSSFSGDVNKNVVSRALESALQISSVAQIPSAVSGAKAILTKGGPALKNAAFPQGAGSQLRNAVVQTAEEAGKTVDGNSLVGAIDNWATRASKANPAASKTINKYLDGVAQQFLDKKLTPSEAFNLWEDARKGFTAAGTKGSSLESSYHRAVRDVIRKELEDVAPGFEKGTKMIKEGLNRTKYLEKVGSGIAYSVPTGIASALLLNYLMGKKK